MSFRCRSKTEGSIPVTMECSSAASQQPFDECALCRGCSQYRLDFASDESDQETCCETNLCKEQDDDDDEISLCSWTTDHGDWESLPMNKCLSACIGSDCGSDRELCSDSSTCNGHDSPVLASSPVGKVSPMLLPSAPGNALHGMCCAAVCVCYMPMFMPLPEVHHAFDDYSVMNDLAAHEDGQASKVEERISLQRNRLELAVALEPESLDVVQCDTRTTLILRNCPTDCSRDTLLEILDSLGFRGSLDFIHMPVDFKTQNGIGYAVLNMVSNHDARLAFQYIQGFDQWPTQMGCACEVGWNTPTQGLSALIARYRNSPLMHHSVPESIRPALFVGGVRTAFPVPTAHVRPPRIRCSKPRSDVGNVGRQAGNKALH